MTQTTESPTHTQFTSVYNRVTVTDLTARNLLERRVGAEVDMNRSEAIGFS
jgi:hypothetical protein